MNLPHGQMLFRPRSLAARPCRTIASLSPRPSTSSAPPSRSVVLQSSPLAAAPLVLGSLSSSLASALQPAADTFVSFNLPEPLVHWGHPGNMLVVLLFMGGYGTWKGFQIRGGGSVAEVAEAKVRCGTSLY